MSQLPTSAYYDQYHRPNHEEIYLGDSHQPCSMEYCLQPEEGGGLGLRKIENIYTANSLKLAWIVSNDREGLWSTWMREKCMQSRLLWEVPSYSRSSIMAKYVKDPEYFERQQDSCCPKRRLLFPSCLDFGTYTGSSLVRRRHRMEESCPSFILLFLVEGVVV